MKPARAMSAALVGAVLLLSPSTSACGQSGQPGKDIPSADGPLAIKVVYPGPNDRVDVLDSSFVLGSIGDGRATLTINGQPARVSRNGAFLGWIEYPDENPAKLVLVATRGSEKATATVTVKRVERFRPGSALWIDSTSMSPRGKVWWPGDEPLTLGVRASEDARLELVMPNGRRLPLGATQSPAPVADALRAFDRDTMKLHRPRQGDRFEVALRGASFGAAIGPVLGTAAAAGRPAAPAAATWSPLRVEAIRGGDTVRVRWPLDVAVLDTLPIATRLDGDRRRQADDDGITTGRAHPGATYHWFFPTGTVARVTGRINDDVRIRLSDESSAWVPLTDAQLGPSGSLGRPAQVGSITMTPLADRITVRIPVGRRVPIQVDEEEKRLRLTLYDATADINWLRYGPADSLLRLARWRQVARDEVEISFDLDEPVWGYRSRWDRNDLVFEIRRPPRIDRGKPLSGRLIVVDAGHPPTGSTGPTGLTEPEANLAIAKRLVAMLEDAGAKVLQTRPDAKPVELGYRSRFADSVGAEVLVSIHNNAIPDGINPFENDGTSVFYFHPRSLPLARAVQRRLVEQFGTRDLGVARADLSLARPTWMPAILAEGLFIMVPEHEAVLRQESGQKRYARAVFEALEDFLRDRSPTN